jgi:uncharacterized membrane protein
MIMKSISGSSVPWSPKLAKRNRTGLGRQSMDRNDDCYWKLGVFYFNREDPAILVPKRRGALGRGLGRTLNFAHPLSWLVIVVPIAVAVITSTTNR